MISIRNFPNPLRIAVVILFLIVGAMPAFAQTATFTYQGKLQQSGAPANGSYDFQFKVFDALTDGTQLPAAAGLCLGPITLDRLGVQVTNGAFSVQLNFGFTRECPTEVFSGADRFLDISVRSASGGGAYTPLSPRQQITSTPYAVRSYSAASADNAISATQLGGIGANQFVQTTDSRFAGGTLPWQTVSGASQQAQPSTGYLATDAAQVTITLPSSPNVGDVVRVSGGGSGGWKIAQNSGQSILGANVGLIGASWMPRDSIREWGSVASSADGSKLVAGDIDGSGIYTSTDFGVTWTVRALEGRWHSIASSADGVNLAAIDYGGNIYISSDSGVSWTPRASATIWRSVASSADGSKLVAVIEDGPIFTSTDFGVSWTQRAVSRKWWSVASSADGSKLVAVVLGGLIYTSSDSGVTWIERGTVGRFWQSVASSADGNKLVAVVGGGQIYTSTDAGQSWGARDNDRSWWSVASSADGSKLVAVVLSGQIYTSTNSGVTWTVRESNRSWTSVASSADGNKLVAGVQNGRIYTSNSNIAGPTGFLTGEQFSAIELQYIGNGQWLPLSYIGTFIGN